MSQHKYVGFTLFGRISILQCSEFGTVGFWLARGFRLSLMKEEPSASRTLPPEELPWTRRQSRVQCTVPAGAAIFLKESNRG
jgi:hypothetical protein